jgi:23S rRNA (adenine2503-C2)-methyltransferase
MNDNEIIDPRAQDPREFLSREEALGFSETQLRRLLGAAVGGGELAPRRWAEAGILPKQISARLGELPRLSLERTVVSPSDGFQKLLLRAPDGFPIEAVIIPLKKESCVTVCLSSQVGCVMGCAFCATARMRERRNLETWEIVDQLLHARALCRSQGRRVTGAVFMGMGEPFLNYHNVLAAAEVLRFPVRDALSGNAITISTVGLVPEIERFTDEKRPFRLSISLGSAIDEKRAALVPVAARTPVRRVMQAARRHALARGERVMLAYVCISEMNVGEEDARALADLIGDTPVRLDLIEVTDATGRFKRPGAEELNVFRDALRKYLGQPVARRYSGGADINAACGTLAGS